MSKVELMALVRDKIKSLKAYSVENFDCDIKLHANENPFPPPQEVLDLFQKSLKDYELNRYPDPECKNLKATLSKRIGVSSGQLVIGNGSDELIYLIMQIFCGEGDSVAFPDPTFAMYSILAKGLGLNPQPFTLNPQWDFNAKEFLEFTDKTQPKVVFISYPNNPTGNCFSQPEVQAIIENFKGIVVLDEAYFDFSLMSFINDLKKHNNLIILRSLSKIGLAGLRVGFGVADPQIIEQINKVRLPYNSNTLSQAIAEKMLGNFGPIQKQIDFIIDERKRLVKALSKIDGLTAFPSDANFILFRTQNNANDLFKKLASGGILIRDLGGHPQLKNCLRATIGTREENDKLLEQIKSLTAE